jgi:hypothetical protein
MPLPCISNPCLVTCQWFLRMAGTNRPQREFPCTPQPIIEAVAPLFTLPQFAACIMRLHSVTRDEQLIGKWHQNTSALVTRFVYQEAGNPESRRLERSDVTQGGRYSKVFVAITRCCAHTSFSYIYHAIKFKFEAENHRTFLSYIHTDG